MKFEDWISNYDNELKQFIDTSYPWTSYVIEIDVFGMLKPNADIEDWCEQNLIGRYDIDIVSYFEFEEDSIWFALRWS